MARKNIAKQAARVLLSLCMAIAVTPLISGSAYAESSDNSPDSIEGEGGYANAGFNDGGYEASSKLRSAISIDGYSYYDDFDTFSSGSCSGVGAYRGIDVSYANGTLDWAKIKAGGVDYAIIRVGYIGNDEHHVDTQFFNNVKGCLENRIPFGFYVYSYVKGDERAKSGADHVLSLMEEAGLSSEDVAYPIYLDLEDASTEGSNFASIATTFCGTIERAGYSAGVYANKYWWETFLTDGCFNNWYKWIAQYNTTGLTYSGVDSVSFKTFGSMWQFSSYGSIAGIENVRFDLNYTYMKPESAVERVWGNTVDQTSAAISAEAFKSSSWVILANDKDFADAMSATGLAGTLGCPIILTDPAGLTSAAKAEISRLGAKNAYVIGGKYAMNENILSQLEDMGVDSKRVWGSYAWDTSVACANKIAEHGGNGGGHAIVTTSQGFEDALSISSFAYKYQVPILLQTVSGDNPLPSEAVTLIKDLSGTVYVPGGTIAVRPSTVESVFGASRVVRLAGSDAYDTSNQIATYMVEEGLLSAEVVAIACGAKSGKGLDALSGSALAGASGGVMLLANANLVGGKVSTVTIEGIDSSGTPAFLESHAVDVARAYVLGGSVAMPEPLFDKVEEILGVE